MKNQNAYLTVYFLYSLILFVFIWANQRIIKL